MLSLGPTTDGQGTRAGTARPNTSLVDHSSHWGRTLCQSPRIATLLVTWIALVDIDALYVVVGYPFARLVVVDHVGEWGWWWGWGWTTTTTTTTHTVQKEE